VWANHHGALSLKTCKVGIESRDKRYDISKLKIGAAELNDANLPNKNYKHKRKSVTGKLSNDVMTRVQQYKKSDRHHHWEVRTFERCEHYSSLSSSSFVKKGTVILTVSLIAHHKKESVGFMTKHFWDDERH
jgi:hypothetical protein